jgi:2-polyprenyl-3-methyl-5-hydroxy-6-metoxy-1,4-benzoquinol methylase
MNDDPNALWEANAETWTRHVRAGYDVYRDHHNTPAFVAMLPPIAGLGGLDIGCGEGANTRTLAALGARMTAIDVAPTFVRHATASERSEPHGITYLVAAATALPFAEAAFDFATAFMSLMDVADAWQALREAHRVVRPGGFLQFSILHPCFAPPHRRVRRDEAGTAYAIEIGRYFEREPKFERWQFSDAPPDVRARSAPFRVMTFQRTLADWVNALVEIGWRIERFGEPSATAEQAAALPPVQDTRVAPLFLHVRVRR